MSEDKPHSGGSVGPGDTSRRVGMEVLRERGLDREPDPYDGTYPVTPAAAEAYVELEASAGETHLSVRGLR